MRVTLRAFFSRISVRILAFNLLVVFLPVGGLLLLPTYEKQLLRSLEHALVQQGRVLAASLGDAGPRLAEEAVRVLLGLRQRHDARMRVLDAGGAVLADSSRLGPREDGGAAGADAGDAETEQTRRAEETFLYRFASFPIRVWRKFFRPPVPPHEGDEFYSGAERIAGPEVIEALAGRYGAATRISAGGQQSVTLYSAIPIWNGDQVAGAVLVTQSTYRILSDLYTLRLDIFTLFLTAVVTAAVLSLLVSATISIPVRRLRDQARAILDPRGRLKGTFAPARRRDEIGDLSRSLGELTQRLEKHIRFMESFASDVSHEFKNPLAGIRSAAELALSTPEESERRSLLVMVLEDVARMERLLSGVREISRIDAGDAGEEVQRIEVKGFAQRVLEGFRLRGAAGKKRITFSVAGEQAFTILAPERLAQALENLVDNAASFSPDGGRVEVSVQRDGAAVRLRVTDEGPGIPEQHRSRIFDRFFSYRPGDDGGSHAGLGLAIVKSIVESRGGSVEASNLPGRGACFEMHLPLA
ncbi:MAG: sensor N-terminal transmembrane domain-containing protein [Acidobacteria bacterium]|nr:sensor N-terminal transmembrane domain-containing protein [Acidobacteriota bacterium]